MTDQPRTLTITQAAEVTGLSRKSIEHRVNRNQLQSVLKGSRRLIPVSELVRNGLLAEDADGALVPAAPQLPAPQALPAAKGIHDELLDRLQRQAEELGRAKLLEQTAIADRDKLLEEQRTRERLERENGEARVQVAELEAQLRVEREARAAAEKRADGRRGLRGLLGA